MRRELECHDRQKSFYGKAHVIAEAGEELLQSYDTIVCKVTKAGRFVRLWGGWSATTARHINSFRHEHGLPAIGKAEWIKLEVEEDKRWNGLDIGTT